MNKFLFAGFYLILNLLTDIFLLLFKCVASLVKLVVQEIEERVSKQADNLRKVQMFQLSVLVYELHSKDL